MRVASDVRPPPIEVLDPQSQRLMIGLLLLAAAGVEGTITSWWRDPATNARVGGNPRSLHLIGLAWDLRADGAGAAIAEGWRRLGLQAFREDQPPHFHLELQLI